MENASKALIMAGGILIALLVISLLVFSFGNIKEYMFSRDNIDEAEQISEFNKQYDVYYRDNLYGTDIMSLANKIVDYNKRESDSKGYYKVDIKVKFKNDVNATASGYSMKIDKNSSYTAQQVKDISDDLVKVVEEKGKEKVGTDKKKKTIASYAGMRDDEIINFLEIDKSDTLWTNTIKPKRNDYLTLKAALTKLKTKQFKAVEFEYKGTNGRITVMNFEEV